MKTKTVKKKKRIGIKSHTILRRNRKRSEYSNDSHSKLVKSAFIIGIIGAVLSIVPFVGFVLGIAGRVLINKAEQNGIKGPRLKRAVVLNKITLIIGSIITVFAVVLSEFFW